MRPRFAGVVWDVDGVLVDSEPLHFAAMVAVLGGHGLAYDAAENARWVGKGLGEIWEGIPGLAAAGLTFEGLLAKWIARYVARADSTLARPPAPAIVADLARRGVPQAAASSSPRAIVEANLRAAGVAGHLVAALACEDVARSKPAPDLYLAAVARLGLPATACLAIEDTETGVAAARAAGLTVLAWPNAMTREMDFSAADAVLDDLAQFDWARIRGGETLG